MNYLNSTDYSFTIGEYEIAADAAVEAAIAIEEAFYNGEADVFDIITATNNL